MESRLPLLSLNRRLHEQLVELVAPLSDAQIHTSAPAIDARPLMDVALHAHRTLLGMASIASTRPLPIEQWAPKQPPETTTVELIERLTNHFTRVEDLLGRLPEETFTSEVTMPWGQRISLLEALTGALAHGFVHAGQITGIRALAGFPTPPDGW